MSSALLKAIFEMQAAATVLMPGMPQHYPGYAACEACMLVIWLQDTVYHLLVTITHTCLSFHNSTQYITYQFDQHRAAHRHSSVLPCTGKVISSLDFLECFLESVLPHWQSFQKPEEKNKTASIFQLLSFINC